MISVVIVQSDPLITPIPTERNNSGLYACPIVTWDINQIAKVGKLFNKLSNPRANNITPPPPSETITKAGNSLNNLFSKYLFPGELM